MGCNYFKLRHVANFYVHKAKAASGAYEEAQEIFQLISSEKLRNDYVVVSWLVRCYIMNRQPRLAWELYLKQETSAESFGLLQLIANDCYRMGQFFYSAKAFDVLCRLDPSPEHAEGRRGACIGTFQMIIADRESRDRLRDVVNLLRSTSMMTPGSASTISNPQTEYFIRIIRKWAKENDVSL